MRVIFKVIAQREEQCVLTGQLIRLEQTICLGLTTTGDIVSLSAETILWRLEPHCNLPTQ